jgi:hypothetical protein
MYGAGVSADDDLRRVPAVAIDVVCEWRRIGGGEADGGDKTRTAEPVE